VVSTHACAYGHSLLELTHYLVHSMTVGRTHVSPVTNRLPLLRSHDLSCKVRLLGPLFPTGMAVADAIVSSHLETTRCKAESQYKTEAPSQAASKDLPTATTMRAWPPFQPQMADHSPSWLLDYSLALCTAQAHPDS
jgi:hypothetical protein